MESEGTHIEKPDWREEFERDVIRRSGISDEEGVRKKHGEYEPPAYRIQEARERDERMVTSRELLALHVLQAKVKQEHQGALEPYYEELLSRVVEKIKWALSRLDLSERKDRDLELLREEIGNSPPKDRMICIDEIVNAMHIRGPIARYIVRDFSDLADKEIKEFFDTLREY